jgi:mono/diheme cytochrome c family protein
MNKTKIILGLFFLFGVTLILSLLLFISKKTHSDFQINEPINWTNLSTDPSVLKNGEFQFKVRCSKCHGMVGQGSPDGPVLNNRTSDNNEETLNTIYTTIFFGLKDTEMKGWGKKLRNKDIKAISIYVNQLSK